MRTYKTMQGDMWDAIAFRELGSESHTAALMRENLQHIDMYSFPAGIVLLLPDVGEQNSGELPPWKEAAG